MQFFSRKFRFTSCLCVVIFVCSVTALDLRKCADFDQHTEFDKFSYQNEIKPTLNVYDGYGTPEMEEMLEFFNQFDSTEFDESNVTSYKSDPIKYVPSRIMSEGYPCDVHEVITDDGYILELHRIPYGKQSPQTDKPRPPILVMHPFEESSNGWVVLGPDHSLAYLLADAGYDVWMGNSRGTEVSRRHVRLRPTGWNQKKYWDFSLHELGVYDLPAFIDHILNVSKFTKLNYVGYSQGGNSFLVLMSSRPEYNDKIIEAHLMAPAAFFKVNHNALFKTIQQMYYPLKRAFAMAGVHKLTLNNKLATNVVQMACKNAVHSTPFACKLFMTIFDSNQINCTTLKSILVATPSGASLKQGIHYIQFMRSKGFHQFDYDSKWMNKRVYGRETPPPYDLTKITAPINLYYSKDDNMVAAENIIELQSHLNSLKSTFVIPIDDFSHVDFIYSRYLREVLNLELIRRVNKANGK